ncbi:hypothetical protein P9E08_08435 [Bacillus mojavensis]|uniref:hypothetical protein n=1 Tax=Bacillus mojavensis TaxID=72360 RepID=UPI002DBE3A00|nr:hypothetical protein [Bacillus mojavensis]MEC1625405.1 hypothetical protein [Bacillus mojavensis]
MTKKPTIKEAYSHEISEIYNVITQIENGYIYEIRGQGGYPSFSTAGKQLRDKLSDLIRKIDKEAPSDTDDFI